MSKFIEELENGDCFESKDSRYVVTSDFKSNGKRLCVDIKTGSVRWFEANDIVEKIAIFYMNKENLIVAIKETAKDDAT